MKKQLGELFDIELDLWDKMNFVVVLFLLTTVFFVLTQDMGIIVLYLFLFGLFFVIEIVVNVVNHLRRRRKRLAILKARKQDKISNED